MNEIPEVRHWLACDAIVPAEGVYRCSLTNVYQVIRPVPGDSFPLLRPVVMLYAVLTNGRGVHTFQVIVVRGVGPFETLVRVTATFVHNLGNDPLVVHGMPLRIVNLILDQPGQYEFRLLCDGQVIARELIEVRVAG